MGASLLALAKSIYCIHGHPAYPVTLHVQGPFKGAHLNNAQKDLYEQCVFIKHLVNPSNVLMFCCVLLKQSTAEYCADNR